LAKAGTSTGVRLVRCAFTQNVREEAVARRRFGVERNRVVRSGGTPLVTVMKAAETPQRREADAAPVWLDDRCLRVALEGFSNTKATCRGEY
jgi:hypothetical protein